MSIDDVNVTNLANLSLSYMVLILQSCQFISDLKAVILISLLVCKGGLQIIGQSHLQI